MNARRGGVGAGGTASARRADGVGAGGTVSARRADGVGGVAAGGVSARRVRVVAVRALLALLLCAACARAAADVMVVTLLGTGTPRPEVSRFGQAVLVEAGNDKLLFDAGRGAAQRVMELGLDFADLHTVFVTHLHYDHIIGLPDLLLSGWVFGRAQPLEVRGPAGIAAHLRHLEQAYKRDIELRLSYTKLPPAGAAFRAVEIDNGGGEGGGNGGAGGKNGGNGGGEGDSKGGGKSNGNGGGKSNSKSGASDNGNGNGGGKSTGMVWRRGDLKVTAFVVKHGVVKPSFGYRVDYRGRSAVISGDTSYSPAVVAHARGADLLVHEIAAASDALQRANPRLVRVLNYHATPEEVARVVREAKPRMTALVHPLIFGVGEADILARIGGAPDKVIFGEDRMAFDIGDRLRVYKRPGASP